MSAGDRAPGSLGELFGSRLAVLREQFLDEKTAAGVRQRLAQAGYLRYPHLDRGRYEFTDAIAEPALLARLQSAASEVTGRALKVARPAEPGPLGRTGVRALRLGAGDYLLAHHDLQADDGTVELLLDLSPPSALAQGEAIENAGVVYTRRSRGAPRFGSHAGQPFFHVPVQPGTLAIVERDATVRCHHGYLSKRWPALQIVRLILRLQPA